MSALDGFIVGDSIMYDGMAVSRSSFTESTGIELDGIEQVGNRYNFPVEQIEPDEPKEPTEPKVPKKASSSFVRLPMANITDIYKEYL